MNSPLLEVVGLTRSYIESDGSRVSAVNNLNLTVDIGEVVAVMGPSGSGKSTLLNIVGLLDTKFNGSVKLGAADYGTLTSAQADIVRRDEIGFVFQSYHLISAMTVLENVALHGIIKGELGRTWRARASEILKELHLDSLSSRYPGQLSGGQQQRVAVARAVYHLPTIILADEPTGNLDSLARKDVLHLLTKSVREGVVEGLLIVTHDMTTAAFADRVILVHDGIAKAQLNLTDLKIENFSDVEGGSREDRLRAWLAPIHT